MFDSLAVLVLPEQLHAMSSDVIRRWVRRLDAQQYSGELCLWEGEGGKLAASPAHRTQSGVFSRFPPA